MLDQKKRSQRRIFSSLLSSFHQLKAQQDMAERMLQLSRMSQFWQSWLQAKTDAKQRSLNIENEYLVMRTWKLWQTDVSRINHYKQLADNFHTRCELQSGISRWRRRTSHVRLLQRRVIAKWRTYKNPLYDSPDSDNDQSTTSGTEKHHVDTNYFEPIHHGTTDTHHHPMESNPTPSIQLEIQTIGQSLTLFHERHRQYTTDQHLLSKLRERFDSNSCSAEEKSRLFVEIVGVQERLHAFEIERVVRKPEIQNMVTRLCQLKQLVS